MPVPELVDPRSLAHEAWVSFCWSSAQSIDWNVAGPHQYPFSCEVWKPFMMYDDFGGFTTCTGGCGAGVGVPGPAVGVVRVGVAVGVGAGAGVASAEVRSSGETSSSRSARAFSRPSHA